MLMSKLKFLRRKLQLKWNLLLHLTPVMRRMLRSLEHHRKHLLRTLGWLHHLKYLLRKPNLLSNLQSQRTLLLHPANTRKRRKLLLRWFLGSRIRRQLKVHHPPQRRRRISGRRSGSSLPPPLARDRMWEGLPRDSPTIR